MYTMVTRLQLQPSVMICKHSPHISDGLLVRRDTLSVTQWEKHMHPASKGVISYKHFLKKILLKTNVNAKQTFTALQDLKEQIPVTMNQLCALL